MIFKGLKHRARAFKGVNMKINIDDNILLCPSCDGDYLHHEKIEVFDHNEDSQKGLHTTIENKFPKVDNDLRGNPSSRRHGMLIHFYCEF
jgi:hypothetical protein